MGGGGDNLPEWEVMSPVSSSGFPPVIAKKSPLKPVFGYIINSELFPKKARAAKQFVATV